MQRLSRSLYNQPVFSLAGGAQIGVATEPIIDPHKLQILGWRVKASGVPAILLAEDARDSGTDGISVNDDSALSDPKDLARHQEVLGINFQLIGKPVKSKRERIGKVTDFTYDDSMLVSQLYVEPPILKLFGAHDTRIVGRNQIKEVTDTYILVGDAEIETKESEAEPAEADGALPETA